MFSQVRTQSIEAGAVPSLLENREHSTGQCVVQAGRQSARTGYFCEREHDLVDV